MPDQFVEKKYFGNPLWMWFVRGTMALSWIVGSWALKTLLNVDKNQALMTISLTNLAIRTDKLEARNDERDKEERERLYSRVRAGGVPIP